MNIRRKRRSEVDRQLSNWSRRRILSWFLFGVALVVALQHLLAHASFRPIPLSMGWQDLLIGYPTALVIAIIAAIAIDPKQRV